MTATTAIILAAGDGKRMKTSKSKVLMEACGKPLLKWVYNSVLEAGIEKSVIVIGHKQEEVRAAMGPDIMYVFQKQQLGTGHAVAQTEKFLTEGIGSSDTEQDNREIVVVLYGSAPLISSQVIKDLCAAHRQNNNVVTVAVEKGSVSDGVDQTDSVLYCFNADKLFSELKCINSFNPQSECYLGAIVKSISEKNLKVGTFEAEGLLDVNDRVQLAQAGRILYGNILKGHMLDGVTIIDPHSTFIDSNVEIGIDTVIYPGTIIEGGSKIGSNCVIGPNSHIKDCVIKDNVTVKNSVAVDSFVDSGSNLGPFAYLRPHSKIGKDVKIGDFVEIKNASIGDNTKVSHLTYIGDAEVGKNVNMGCGTVVVNYDGNKKHKSVIKDNAFVGCNSNLVSPVVVESSAYIAAGSTITDDVPADSLAIARSRQTIKEGWAAERNTRSKVK